MKKQLRIGLVGTGLMGRAHANGYNRIHNFFPALQYEPKLVAVCSRNEEKVKAFAAQWNFESYETDWKALVAREDIDAVDICTPNDSHFEIALACAAAGKMILCEKPLARTLEEGQQMVDEIQKEGVKTNVFWNKLITTNSTGILKPEDSNERLQVIDCKEIFEERVKENNL
jgi:predicted dehydrogenase